MTKLYSFKDLSDAFEIYYKLDAYKYSASGFWNARERGIEGELNYVKERVQDLIMQVEEIDELKNVPILKNCIENLTVLYDL